MKTLEQLAQSGLRGQALSDALYTEMFGAPPPSQNRTPEERQASLENFFAIVDSLTEEDRANNPLAGRPLNTSILEEDCPAGISAA